MVEHQRRIRQQRLHVGPFVVQHPQRIERRPLSGRVIQRQVGEKGLQPLAVVGAVGGVAERGQFESVAGQADRAERLVTDGDHLGIQRGIVGTDGLDPDLLQLSVAAGLRPLVAEERPRVDQLHRQ